jgi:transcriptional regulator
VDTLPDEFITKLLAGIVGFRIAIDHLEGKLKLSQNREPQDQARVTEQLAALGDPQSLDTSRWMADLYGRNGPPTDD